MPVNGRKLLLIPLNDLWYLKDCYLKKNIDTNQRNSGSYQINNYLEKREGMNIITSFSFL